MLNNLVKFEWKSMFRYLWLVWAGLFASSILLGVTYRVYDGLMINTDSGILYLFFKILPTMLFWILFVANILFTIVMVVARFYRDLLCEEGYLMHTLPVKTGHLIASKGIIATVAVAISAIVSVISIFIMAVLGFGADMGELPDLMRAFADMGAWGIIAILEVFIMCVLSIVAQIYQAYTAMSIGQLVGKHRILASVGAYIGINIALSTIVGTIGTICVISGVNIDINFMPGTYAADALSCLIIIIMQMIQCAIFYIITERLLTKHLNLL